MESSENDTVTSVVYVAGVQLYTEMAKGGGSQDLPPPV